MKAKFLKLISIFAISILLFACKSNTTGDSETSGDFKELDQEEITVGVGEVVYPLPSPFELLHFLNDIGAVFEGDVINPPANIDKYITEKSKAINIGVYGADLSYAITYDKSPLINDYIKSVKELSDGLGITVDYSALIDQNNREALTDKDTLVEVVSKTFYETYSFLDHNSDPAFAALMASGFWVEGLFIATHISEYTFDNTEIVNIIFDQKESLGKLLDLLKEHKTDEKIVSILPGLEAIKTTYDKTDSSLTQEQLDEIKTSIATVRTLLVQ